MPSATLEAYVLAIERHLARHRGAEHVLSPRDFALAKQWHAAALPLAAVLAGIDRAAASDGGATSLLRCRRLIEGLAAAAQPEAPAPAQPPGDMEMRLAALQAAIAGARRPMAFELASRRLAELLDLAAVAREPNWSYFQRKLDELDEAVDVAALEALAPAELEQLREDAIAALARQKPAGRAALQDARLRYMRRRARERFALPRVGTG